MPRQAPKSVVGTKITILARHITHDAARIYGSVWKTKKIEGTVVASQKRVPPGGSRNTTFITGDWALPGRNVIKEVNGRLVELLETAGAASAPLAAPAVAGGAAPPAAAAPAPPTTPTHWRDNQLDAHGIIQDLNLQLEEQHEVTAPHPPDDFPTPASDQHDDGETTDTDRSTINNNDNDTNLMAQVAHGRKWVVNHAETQQDINGPIPHREWYMLDEVGDRISESDQSKVDIMSRLDIFLLMFPSGHLTSMIGWTNSSMAKKGYRATTKGEIIKFFGIIILGTRFEFQRRADLWSTRSISKMLDAPRFGKKTGMSRNRFDELWSSICFSCQPDERMEGINSEQYRWMLVDDFVNAFNSFRAAKYFPSEKICADESISRWYGLGGHWINMGLPNYVAMDRKPENGCEIQDACDGRSKIMMQLKLVKGAAENERLAHEDASGLHGTRVLKELVDPWKHTGRLVVADSYFASVPCALALKEMGLRFIGVVKTATREFPFRYLSTVELANKGDYKGVVHIDENTNYKLLSFVWVDRERRYFISNCSSLLPGLPYSRTRWRQVDDLTTGIEPDRLDVTIPQPKCAEIYYEACAMIDRHNRSRQDNLQIERKYVTLKWDMRVNLTILSIIIVDSYYLKKGILNDACDDTENDFYTLLAEEMIENRLDEGIRTRHRGRGGERSVDSPSSLVGTDGRVASGIGAHLTPTKKRRKMNGRTTNYCQQMWCSICRKYKTSYVCSVCRDKDDEDKIYFCNPKTNRLCFLQHIQDKHEI